MSNKTPKPENIPSYDDVHSALGSDRMNFMSQMIGQQLEAEEEMPPQPQRPQESRPQPLPPIPGAEIGRNP